MKIILFTSSGEKKGEIEISEKIFGSKINENLIHKFVNLQRANARNPIAHTLKRGEISATTAKLFKQKGTGRARRGAKSTNLLRGGGVTHGPRNNRNFSKKMPKKERRAALRSILSSRAAAENIFAIENFNFEKPKTKNFTAILEKIPAAKKYLFVLPEKNFTFEKSVANVQNCSTVLVNFLNPLAILRAEKIFFVGNSAQKTAEIFAPK